MTMRTLVRWIILALMFAGSAAPTPAEAGDVAAQRAVRAGRIVSDTGWGLLATGGVATGVGYGLTVYDYRGTWWDKYRYDEAYLRRERVGLVLGPAGLITMGTSVPLLMIGPAIEAVGLRQFVHITSTPGWVGLSVAGLGATLSVIGAAAWAPGFTVAGVIVASLGFLTSIGQYAINVVVSKRLPASLREDLYKAPRKKKVTLAAAPTILEGGGGAALVGRF